VKRTLRKPKAVPLDRRVQTLQTITEIGNGRLPQEDVDAARAVLNRTGERLELGAEFTVVALAGATGSGKSSLFNALAGAELSQVGVRRPTTSVASAAIWGDLDANELLRWLQVDRRHRVEVQENRGLILLDLPDHDSTESAHRAEVDRLVERVDIFVWVVDPQKYADALLHEVYLRPLATHAPVTVVVLNQIDKLSPEDRRRCIDDLTRLLADDGLEHVSILATSARMGLGLPELRALIATRVAANSAASERLAADVAAAAARFRRYCGDGSPSRLGKPQRRDLIGAMASAAGADLVADAAARSHRRKAALATGWPFTLWLRRLRPDPLARLHLGADAGGGRTSLRAAASRRAEIENAMRTAVTSGSHGMPDPWPDVMRTRVMRPTDEVVEHLDRAVSRADLGDDSRPRWWSVVGALQKLIALLALAGSVWLTVLFVLEWFQVPRPPTPEVGSFPWPTLLLLGGVVAGLVIAWLSGIVARVGAGRRRRRAFASVARAVEAIAEEHVLSPIAREQDAYNDICVALGEAKAMRSE
jgi:GTP-binding protein EngB required for normal cell division